MGCGASGDQHVEYFDMVFFYGYANGDYAEAASEYARRIPNRDYHPHRHTIAKEKLSAAEGADLLDTFLRIERDIWKEERAPPAPALGHAMVRLARLSSALEAAQADLSADVEELSMVPGSVPDISAMKGESQDESIKRVISVLGVNKNPHAAAEHEEFIATLNRKAMKETRMSWLSRRKGEAQEEVERLTERVQHLQALYEHQDSLLEQLESRGRDEDTRELGRIRAYRDTLYNGELSWREAARLVEAGAALSRIAAQDWEQAKDSMSADSRWRIGVETRKGIQEATLCVQGAQLALSGVQFPYCTQREITTILQVLEYLFTDLQIPERYNHASHVYNNFYKRAMALHVWLKKTMEETIHKDVLEVDQRFGQLATKVTNQRITYIRQLAGLGAVSSYEQNRLYSDRRGSIDKIERMQATRDGYPNR